ncbi:UNVERIFIED_CONTAM: hypothetical protein RMT77_009566 [Armadillidium vulgare]
MQMKIADHENSTLFIIRNIEDAKWLAEAIYNYSMKEPEIKEFWIGLLLPKSVPEWLDGRSATDTCSKYSPTINECALPNKNKKYSYAEVVSETQMNIVSTPANVGRKGYICQKYS